jgi:hypothetical protein
VRVLKKALDPKWRKRAACRSSNPKYFTDFETPFGRDTDVGPALNAISLCRHGCNVTEECEEWRKTLDNGGACMIWAGNAYGTEGNRIRECGCGTPILPVLSGPARTRCSGCKQKTQAAERAAKELAEAEAA